MKAALQLVTALAAAVSVSCVPWTVRPIESSEQHNPQERFNAATWVETNWDSRVAPTVLNSAIELSTVPQEASGRAYLVRGQAKVVRVDTSSAVRLAFIDLLPGDGKPDAAIQLGPVIRGTALRDSLDFIRFGDFANQIDFADVSNALNERAVTRVLANVPAAAELTGRTVEFHGAFAAGKGELPHIIPVRLKVATEP